MEPTQRKSVAGDFFLHLGAIILLYISFGSLIALLFNYINYFFPDTLVDQGGYYYYDPYSSAIRFSLAVLIILFPFFWTATWKINKNLREYPEKRELPIRKWLLYLNLFVATGLVIGDLVVLVNTFLNGELTTRFILKVLTVLVLAGIALFYYWLDLKGRYIERPMLGHWFGIGAGILVIASVVGGFFVIGSPVSQRLIRFDQEKINDLQNIQWQIVSYWQTKGKLPANLDALKDPISGQIIPVDQQTGAAYEYSVSGPLAFTLCATFNKEGPVNRYQSEGSSIAPVGDYGIDNNWKHGVGKVCFDRTIDPDRYPVAPRKI